MKKFFILIAILCFFSACHTAYACQCIGEKPPFAFNQAKAVFIGQMLGGTEKLSWKDQDGKLHFIEAGDVRFKVEEVFKGDVKGEVIVEIDSQKDTSCGPYGLTPGEHYIVYAYGAERYGYSDEKDAKTLHTGVCTRTSSVNMGYAKEDLDFLRNLPPPGTGGTLEGSVDVSSIEDDFPRDIKVAIRSSDNQVVTVQTDADGKFQVEKLKPGKYRVEPEIPANYTSKPKFQEIALDDFGTASANFSVYAAGRVLGRVFDENGRDFNSATLRLMKVGEEEDDLNYYSSAYSTGENGEFEAEHIPPGEYVLYLTTRNQNEEKEKEEKKFYYPGTFAREDAKVIKVGLGETVKGLKFSLPTGFQICTIEGKVILDGKPANGVEVLLFFPKTSNPNGFIGDISPRRTRTDEQGRFQIESFAGETYSIKARGSKQTGKKREIIYMHSPSKRILLKKDLKDFDLVLSEAGFTGVDDN